MILHRTVDTTMRLKIRARWEHATLRDKGLTAPAVFAFRLPVVSGAG